MGFHTDWRRSPGSTGRSGPRRRRPFRPRARGPSSPRPSSGPAGRRQAAAGRARPGAATSAPPSSPGSRAREAAGPSGCALCPAAPPAPTRHRAGPPTRRAPPARPAWPCGRATGSQAARAQQPGAPASRFAIESPQARRTSAASILVYQPQHSPLIVQVAWSRQERTPSRRFCDTAAGLPGAPVGGRSRVPLGPVGCRVAAARGALLCPPTSGGRGRWGAGRGTRWRGPERGRRGQERTGHLRPRPETRVLKIGSLTRIAQG